MKDLTELLTGTASHILQGAISAGGVVLGENIPGLNGVLAKDRKLSDSIQKRLEQEAQVKGFISTDELPAYGITQEEKDKILKALGCGSKDVGVLVAAPRPNAEKAIQIIREVCAGYRPKKAAQAVRVAKAARKAKTGGKAKPKPARPKKTKKSAARAKRSKSRKKR